MLVILTLALTITLLYIVSLVRYLLVGELYELTHLKSANADHAMIAMSKGIHTNSSTLVLLSRRFLVISTLHRHHRCCSIVPSSN